MPGFDGTGPMGAGRMTGGRRGFCATRTLAYSGRLFYGAGRRFHAGLGRDFFSGLGRQAFRARPYAFDFGFHSHPQYDPETEITDLKNRADLLKSELDQIRSRIDQLENSDEGGKAD